jgi:hypothetical protein
MPEGGTVAPIQSPISTYLPPTQSPLPSISFGANEGVDTPFSVPGRSLQDMMKAKRAEEEFQRSIAPPVFGPAGSQPFQQSPTTGRFGPSGPPIPKEQNLPALIEEVKTVTPNFDKLSPAAKIQAIGDYNKAKTASVPAVDQQALAAYLAANPGKSAYDFEIAKAAAMRPSSGDARVDKSYQFHITQLGSLSKPVDEAVARVGRLEDSLNQNTPQADALVAPELLSVMAGGAGSGLRMNEAEIARIVGGRSNFESIKAALNKWQLDPTKALSITPSQRQQIRDLVAGVADKLRQKQQVLTDAGQNIVNATDVNTHRQALAEARKGLTAIDSGQGAAVSARPRASDGKGNFVEWDGKAWVPAK